MLTITDKISLETKTDDKLVFYTRYLVQLNFTFDLYVVFGKKKGSSHFCVRIDQIQDLCKDLEKMNSNQLRETEILDNDSDAFVNFQIAEKGILLINGQLGVTHEEDFFNFKFKADQTSIPQFVASFNQILQHQDK